MRCLFACVVIVVFFNDTATTEIYTYDTLFPYTTLFRSDTDRTRADEKVRAVERIVNGLGFTTIRESVNALEARSEEHTSELQSLMRISYAVFCLKKKNTHQNGSTDNPITK